MPDQSTGVCAARTNALFCNIHELIAELEERIEDGEPFDNPKLTRTAERVFGGTRAQGCCGVGGSDGNGAGVEQRPFRANEVEQRARLLAKPEPQYTEEARRNQITGTVMLRVVFSALGQVEQIRAVQSLPFGLTERAIAAARQIRFMPATKGGRSVSVYMQLEYNFNLY